VNVYFQQK